MNLRYGQACTPPRPAVTGLRTVAASRRIWQRGFVLGLACSISSALGIFALGLTWIPDGAAVIVGCLLLGLLLALSLEAYLPRTRAGAEADSPAPPASGTADESKSGRFRARTTRSRLAEAKACLEHLEAERERRGDPGFGKATADRIVWAELLELELQNLDERMSRIREAADDPTAGRPRMSAESNWRPQGPVQRKHPGTA